MKKLLFFTLFIFIIGINAANADIVYDDPQKFEEFNPNLDKYQFSKSYIAALEYFQKNADRAKKSESFEGQDLREARILRQKIDALVMDNVNVRVARNLLRKYSRSENGLILKVTEIFTNMCNDQINFNNQERDFLEAAFDSAMNNQMVVFDHKGLTNNIRAVSVNRKESLKELLHASLLVNKILISNKANEFGEYLHLGITAKQRNKLIKRLEAFSGDKFQGELREGQTFLQGSVAAIRELLENSSWKSLDG